VRPGERLLEIGCGSGVAAALVCARLDDGRLLAIDRSPVQLRSGGFTEPEILAPAPGLVACVSRPRR
jgi:trans-aconitate methyltransferase